MGLDPATIGLISAGIGAASSLGGAIMSSRAQSSAANAIAAQNFATNQAQNQAFNARLAAANQQTAAQSAVMQQTMADRAAAATQMRLAQQSAMQNQQDVLAAENKQAEALRASGDTAAAQLLQQTTAEQQAAAQQQYKDTAGMLLAGAAPQGPGPTDPSGGGDTETQQAVAKRLAQAATNVRNYGARIASVGSYGAPLSNVADAIAATKSGIMPAQTAEQLLRSGNTVRLLPSQVAWRNAGDIGSATDQLLQARGQAGLDTASLSYGNAVQVANLAQSDADTIAANRAAQAKADALYQQQVSGIFSGLGQIGLYGAGYLAGGPSWLTPGGGAGGVNAWNVTSHGA